MVCLVDDLAMWKDFPKGLRVLLLDRDGRSGAETKSRLEASDYIVSWYMNEGDALKAIEENIEDFHVAIVEVTIGSSCGRFKFLEVVQNLPTIVISNVQCLNTMMKCIALGAAEFLQKPVSEDKLRNIWQHVVYKAFNAGGDALSKSLKPIKETVSTMLQLQTETTEIKIESSLELESSKEDVGICVKKTMRSERFPEPSTPQLLNADIIDAEERVKCSTEKGSTEEAQGLQEQRKSNISVSKSVDNTCNTSISVANVQEALTPKAEEEVNSVDASKTDECSEVIEGSLPSCLHNVDNTESSAEDRKKKSVISSTSYSNKRINKKKLKVDWTPDLHKRFVHAVEQLGIDQAIPSKILELMNVEGLTRHNVASHLQKYRLHRRHILPKNDEKRWPKHRDPMQRNYMPKPVLPYPPFYPNCNVQSSQMYPVWGHPSYQPHPVHLWGNAFYQTWHSPSEISPWKSYSRHDADAWGCPVVPQYAMHSAMTPVRAEEDAVREQEVSKDSYDLHLATEDVIDEAVKEAMSKPWLPLPLGLKPPSTEAVLSELHRRGINTIPPGDTGRRPGRPTAEDPHSASGILT